MKEIHRFYFQLLLHPTHPLRPVILNNVRSSRITAAAGTRLAGAFSASYVYFLLAKRDLQSIPSSLTQDCWIRVSPIVQDSPLLLGLYPFGPCFSPNVADDPLRPATHHRLGSLLNYQLPNTIKDYL